MTSDAPTATAVSILRMFSGCVLFGLLVFPARSVVAQDCSCGHPCDVILDYYSIFDVEDHQACLTIEGGPDLRIEAFADVTLTAGEKIVLKNGLSVLSDATLILKIDPLLFCDVTVDGDSDFFDACLDCDDEEPTVNPGGTEVCDGLDNDCDGTPDEGNPGGGAVCDTGLFGVCIDGTETCTGGSLQCIQNVPPSAEICDGLDNDCDNEIDEGALCNDSLSCTLDYCGGALGCMATIDSGKCLIDGVCFSNGQTMPGNICLVCNASFSQTTWSYNNGASCSDNIYCTSGDQCSGGECIGNPVQDSYESNNSITTSYYLGSVDDSDAFPADTFTATIYPESDIDWFRYHDNDTPIGVISPRVELSNIPSGTNYDLCAYFDCDEPYTAELDCVIGSSSSYSGLPGCCSRNSGSTAETVYLDPSCGGWLTDDSGSVYIRVEKVAGAATCVPYTVESGDD